MKVKAAAELYELGALAEVTAALARTVVAKARLNLSDFEQTGVARLCELAMVAKQKMGGFDHVAAVGQNLGDFELAITMVVAMAVAALML